MARTTSSNYSSPSYPIANAATDAFHKEDLQQLALALNGHDHTTGKGLGVNVSSIADNSLSGTKLIDGTVTSAKITDGTIVAADIADATITNAKLGPDVARANLLTNGGFEVWQRGNGPFNGSLLISADRWYDFIAGASPTSTVVVSKETSIVSTGSNASMKAVVTFDGTNLVYIRHGNLLRTSDGYGLKGKTLSVGVDVYCSVTNGVDIRFASDGTGAQDLTSARNTSANTWQRLTSTINVPSDATYVLVDIEVRATCTAYFDNAMLVVGSQPANYVPLHPADDLARCLRYYEIFGEVGTTMVWQGYTTTGQSLQFPLPYRVRKAVTPTLTKVGTWTVLNCAQPTMGNAGVDATFIQCAVTASSTAQFYSPNPNAITVEANPLLIPVGLLMMQGAQPDYVIYGIAIIATWMMSMNAERTADLARQLAQLPGLDGLIDRLRSPAATVRAIALRMLRPVLT